MSKLLRIRDYLLITASAAGEVFEDVRLVDGIVPGLMKGKYGFVPSNFKKRSYAATVSKMLSTGDINKIVGKDGKVYLELTSQGKIEFKRKFPVKSLVRKKWDGYFMEVIFDIPEDRNAIRNSLRRKLKELGFGMLQESVWISPYHFEEDLREFLESEGISDIVFVLEARQLNIGEFKLLAGKIWKIDLVRQRYCEVINRIQGIPKLFGSEREEEIKRIWEVYFSAISIDPNLPDELLIKPTGLIEVTEAIGKLKDFN